MAVCLPFPVLVLVATVLGPPTWSATASFMPQATPSLAQSPISRLAGQFGVEVPTGETGHTPEFYSSLIRSREVLGRIARDSFEVADTAGLRARGHRAGTLAQLLGFSSEPHTNEAAAEVREWLEEDAVAVIVNRETGIVEVVVRTRWADLSREITARIVQLVGEFNLETRQSQAAAERAFIEARTHETLAALRSAEDTLESFLRSNRDFENSPSLRFEHDRLQRQVLMRQEVHTSLAQAYEQARITEVRNTPVITVIDRAELPAKPDSRQIPVRIAAGLLMGLVAGTSAGLGRDYIRRQRAIGTSDFDEFATEWAAAREGRGGKGGSSTPDDPRST